MKRFALHCLLLSCVVLLLVSVWVQASQQAQIAFTSSRNGNDEIYIMDADGKNQHNLTNNPADDDDPAWSPDGKMIAFASNRDTRDGWNAEIYVMDADGKNQRRLTNNPADDREPAWSPDGKMITFASHRDSLYCEIYVMDADGKNQRRLTNSVYVDNRDPAWSPDGKMIAFKSCDENYSYRDWSIEIRVIEIYVWNMDTFSKSPHNLTNNPGWDEDPAWSPDGKTIAFISEQEGIQEIYIMDADGKNQRRLTNNPVRASDPAWSPDGKMIAFSSYRDGNSEIYIMDVDGNNLRRLTNNPAWDRWPSWFDPAVAHPVSPAGKLEQSGTR